MLKTMENFTMEDFVKLFVVFHAEHIEIEDKIYEAHFSAYFAQMFNNILYLNDKNNNHAFDQILNMITNTTDGDYRKSIYTFAADDFKKAFVDFLISNNIKMEQRKIDVASFRLSDEFTKKNISQYDEKTARMMCDLFYMYYDNGWDVITWSRYLLQANNNKPIWARHTPERVLLEDHVEKIISLRKSRNEEIDVAEVKKYYKTSKTGGKHVKPR